MDCQECHERAATLHFTRLINGKKMDTHICEVCAKELEYLTYPEEGYSLHNLLAGLFSFDSNSIQSNQAVDLEQKEKLRCSNCELTFIEFKRTGKFGCTECYDAFSKQINPILRRVHSGNTKHNGKIPKRHGVHLYVKKQLEEYRNQLNKLIEHEEFEEAAVIRDKIKAIKNDDNSFEAGDLNDA